MITISVWFICIAETQSPGSASSHPGFLRARAQWFLGGAKVLGLLGRASVLCTHHMKGDPPKTWNLFIKHCVFILTCLNFSHLQSALQLLQHTNRDIFSTAQNSFWTHPFWCRLVLLTLFVSSLPHWQKHCPLRNFFHPGKQKVAGGEMWWIGRVTHEGHTIFGQKLLNSQHGVGRCARKSPIMKWANVLKESSKKIPWSRAQALTGTLYRWVLRTPT